MGNVSVLLLFKGYEGEGIFESYILFKFMRMIWVWLYRDFI